jgi:hypothetical protein
MDTYESDILDISGGDNRKVLGVVVAMVVVGLIITLIVYFATKDDGKVYRATKADGKVYLATKDDGCAYGNVKVGEKCLMQCADGKVRVGEKCLVKCADGKVRVGVECKLAECADGKVRVGENCLVKCGDNHYRDGIECKPVNLLSHEITNRAPNTRKYSELSVKSYGMGSWYDGINLDANQIGNDITATYGGCEQACLANPQCKSFSRYHTTPNYNSGGRTCSLFSDTIPADIIRNHDGWEGGIGIISGR